jgi:hypothetical protein
VLALYRQVSTTCLYRLICKPADFVGGFTGLVSKLAGLVGKATGLVGRPTSLVGGLTGLVILQGIDPLKNAVQTTGNPRNEKQKDRVVPRSLH